MVRDRPITRVLFAVIFLAGGIAHLVLGRVAPDSYEVFGDTALFGGMRTWWSGFVMPHIGWLTLAVACYEIACGLGMLWRPTVRLAAWGMVGFLVFITVVGYGFPTDSIGEDLLKNRSITLVMALVLVALLGPAREERHDGGRP